MLRSARLPANQPNEDNELTQASDDEEEEADFVLYGKQHTEVVGVRHYAGNSNANEMVLFVREPENPYDCWAIRVDNIRHEKVGHINRRMAAALAPLIDRGFLHIEGIAHGGKKAYTMPVDIYFLGAAANQATVVSHLARCGVTILVSPSPPAGGSQQPSSLGGSLRTSTVGGSGGSLSCTFDELIAQAGPTAMMAPGPEVVSWLYPHQQVALAWLIQRENGGALPPFWEPRTLLSGGRLGYLNSLTNFISNERPAPLRGGILADDMGLGKSLAIISLIATNRPGAAMPAVRRGDLGNVPPDVDLTGEPDSKPALKKRKVSMKPDDGPASLRAVAEAKLAAKAAKEVAKLAELAASQELPPMPPVLGGPCCTLVVCPLSVVSNWQVQLAEHTAGNLKVHVYHGPERNRSTAFLATQDVVITTYATLTSDWTSAGGQKAGRTSGPAPAVPLAQGGLLAVLWLRVVLDEAHVVKNAKTQQSCAARALCAQRRWAVTGTPIQNRLTDLYGLLSFLRLEPLNERTVFMRALERPIKAQDASGVKKLQGLMGAIAMRRTKELRVNGRLLVELPTKTVTTVRVTLTPEEQSKYKRLEADGRSVIRRHLADSALLTHYTTVLEIILRLRQVCDAAGLVPDEILAGALPAVAPGEPPSPELLAKLLAVVQAADDECPVCLSPLEQPVITRCGHCYCRRCIEDIITKQKPICALCRQPVSISELVEPPPEAQGGDGGSAGGTQADPAEACVTAKSSKAAALLERLHRQRDAWLAAGGSGSGRPRPKAVVFSQFVSYLKLLQGVLKASGFSCVRLDGSSTAKSRLEMLEAFADQAEGSPQVFLVSLKAGGVGMNLTAASQVHLMDPWWNAAVEEQAMDRVHRLGQTQPVQVFRYIASDTIEARMLEMQDHKRQLATAAFHNGEIGGRSGRSGDARAAEIAREMRIDQIKLLMDL